MTTTESSSKGPVECKSRNPTPVKSLMRLLGMPSGACRRPLGKLTPQAAAVVVEATCQVWANDPTLLQPIGDAFGVDIEARLADQSAIDALVYSEYQ